MNSRLRFFSRENIFAAAFFSILVTLLWLAVSLLSPFLGDFLWAVILSLSFHPIYLRVKRWLGGRGNVASLLMTILVVVALVLPGFFVLVNLGKEARRTYHAFSTISWEKKGDWVTRKIRALNLDGLLEYWGVDKEQVETAVRNGVGSGLKNVPKIILEGVSSVFKNLALFALHIAFVAVAFFFFLRDGDYYAGRLVELLPLERGHKEIVVNTFSRTVSAVVRGTFITAAAQGLLSGVGFAVAGMPVPVLLGLLTSVNSCIPFLGATSVWLPSAIWLFSQEHYIASIGLAAYGALIVSVVDNILKPWIIGEETKVPVFLLFFTILGGLKVYGLLGVFLGPIIVSLGMAFLSIYRELYLRSAKEKEGQPSQVDPKGPIP